MYFRQSMSSSLPSFFFLNSSNGTIGGFPIIDNTGTYLMECVGIDDNKEETVIMFSLNVKGNLIYFKFYYSLLLLMSYLLGF